LEEASRRNSALEIEYSELRAKKEVVEADLDKNIDDTFVILSQSFFQAVHQVVRQAHVFYNVPPPSGDFDHNMDMFEG